MEDVLHAAVPFPAEENRCPTRLSNNFKKLKNFGDKADMFRGYSWLCT